MIQESRILELYQKGMTLEELWEKYLVPQEIARHILVTNDIEIRENHAAASIPKTS